MVLLPVLREHSWPGLQQGAVSRPLLAGPAESTGTPWVTFAYDSATRLETFTRDALEEQGRTLEIVESEALENLAARPMAWKVVKTRADGSPRVLTIGDEYGAEAVLDAARMLEAQRLLGATAVAATIAAAGATVVQDAYPADPGESVQLAAWAADFYQRTEARRICPFPVIVADGRVVGFLRSVPKGEDVQAKPSVDKRPWWRIWG